MNVDLSFDRLLAYVAGVLPAAEAERIAAVVAHDADAAATVERLRIVARTVREDVTVPESSLASARQIFRDAMARRAAEPTLLDRGWALLERVVARLTFDSRPQAALAGLRGVSDRYQLAFDADGVEIELEIAKGQGGEARAIMGQVSTATGAPAGSLVVLVAAGDETILTQAAADESGVFRLSASRGTVDVLVRVGERLAVLPGVVID